MATVSGSYHISVVRNFTILGSYRKIPKVGPIWRIRANQMRSPACVAKWSAAEGRQLLAERGGVLRTYAKGGQTQAKALRRAKREEGQQTSANAQALAEQSADHFRLALKNLRPKVSITYMSGSLGTFPTKSKYPILKVSGPNDH